MNIAERQQSKTEITSEELRRAIKDIPGYSGEQIRSGLVNGDLNSSVEEIMAYVQINRLSDEQRDLANEILEKSEDFISPCALLEILCDQ